MSAVDILVNIREAVIVVGCKLVEFANRVMGYLEALGYKNVYVLDTDIKAL
ncbi:MAG: rhodanese-like domain-containing protein [Persephonella sp.]|nr:rhodanese-like domain-containing protein [Persephonella sp.]